MRPMAHRKLLTIGNSFSNNALTHVGGFAEETGETFTIGRASLGGCSLEKHWNLSRYSAAHPEFCTYPGGLPGTSLGNLQQLLRAEAWDIVTLQQNSAQSWKPETFHPWFDHLVALVRDLAPSAEIRLHQTWAYRSDSKALSDWGIDHEEMHRRIDAAYQALARKHGFAILPSGPALHRARNAPGRTYVRDPAYDFDAPAAPRLPRQDHSFSAGYHWAITDTPDGIPELRLDANHLNPRGCFLCSATWFAALTGIDVRQTRFRPQEIGQDDRRFLVEIAWETVQQQGSRAAKG